MENKKIGIITYWKTDNNYGTVLQNYSLQVFLQKKGYKTQLIRSDLFNNPKPRAVVFKEIYLKNGLVKTCDIYVKKVIGKILSKINKEVENNKLRKFEIFVEKYLSPTRVYNSIEELEKDSEEFDLFITGSDQVWSTYGMNSPEMEEALSIYLLDFVKNKKRIACAASFGNNSIDSFYKEHFFNSLKEFDFLTVREQSGVENCKQLGIDNVYLQADPVFLTLKEDYLNIASFDIIPSQEYVLIYLLGNETDISIKGLKTFFEKRNLRYIFVTANGITKSLITPIIYPTINEWLGLIARAKYVVTNSFHGTVFSILFNKDFLTILQTGKYEGQNNRVQSLLNQFKLVDRIFNGNDFCKLIEPIQWESINEKINEIRDSSPFSKYIKELV